MVSMNSEPLAIAGCVVEQNGKFLLIQEAKPSVYGLWNIPAGHVDRGETAETAAIREVKEETGYDVELREKLGVYTTASGRRVHVFKAHILSGALFTPDDEILDAEWFTYDEILAMQHANQLRDGFVMAAVREYLGK